MSVKSSTLKMFIECIPLRHHCAVVILFKSVPVHQLSWLALGSYHVPSCFQMWQGIFWSLSCAIMFSGVTRDILVYICAIVFSDVTRDILVPIMCHHVFRCDKGYFGPYRVPSCFQMWQGIFWSLSCAIMFSGVTRDILVYICAIVFSDVTRDILVPIVRHRVFRCDKGYFGPYRVPSCFQMWQGIFWSVSSAIVFSDVTRDILVRIVCHHVFSCDKGYFGPYRVPSCFQMWQGIFWSLLCAVMFSDVTRDILAPIVRHRVFRCDKGYFGPYRVRSCFQMWQGILWSVSCAIMFSDVTGYFGPYCAPSCFQMWQGIFWSLLCAICSSSYGDERHVWQWYIGSRQMARATRRRGDKYLRHDRGRNSTRLSTR